MTWYFADCELDPATRALRRNARDVAVEPKVFDLLLYLLQHCDRYVPRNELMDQLWPDAVVGPAALSRAIKEARRAVGDDGQTQSIIATLHGRGYRLIAAAQRSPHVAPMVAFEATAPEAATVQRAHTVSSTGDKASEALGIAWCYPEYRSPTPLPVADTLVLGRGEDCDVVVAGPDASRRHAQLYRDGPIFVLRDLGSTNGSFVNAQRIDSSAIAAGDVIRLGDALGVVAALHRGTGPQLSVRLDEGLIGSASLARALAPLRAAAGSSLPQVIEGETGTGKQQIAAAVHRWSQRKGALVSVNCADVTAAQLEDSYSRAQHGSLVLDYASELPLDVQPKLLSLVDGRVADADDVRLIVTSQEPLRELAAEGRLRADLVGRLSGTTAQLPPLRARKCDIPALLSHFLSLHSGGRPPAVSAGLVERLCLYDWPFNVRELQTLVRGLLVGFAHVAPLRSSHLPDHMLHRSAAADGPATGDSAMHKLTDALRARGGSVSKASRDLGISLDDAHDLMQRG